MPQTSLNSEDVTSDGPARKFAPLVMVVFGVTGLVVGGDPAVRGAIKLAQSIGISERIIGLTVIALGTSLPELST